VRRRVTLGLAALRAAALGALVLLVWNPTAARVEAGGAPPLVLLDASLSMAGHGGRWRDALDTARALAAGGIIWRFGERVAGFDTLPPTDGASRLAPALDAAAARGGPVTVVSDGAIADLADIPPDLLRRARIVVLPRAPFFDAFIASVDGPRRVAAGDTVRLKVSYGTAGKRPRKGEGGRAKLVVSLSGRRLASRDVALPDSGVVSTELTLPLSPFPGSSQAVPGSLPAGWSALEVRLEGVADSEPRDDVRLFVLEVSPQPSVVLLAAPPDWETRFLARTLEDVARVPVRTFIEAEPGGNRWRDATTLESRAPGDVARAVAGAALVIEAGDAPTFNRFGPKGAVLLWPGTRRLDGDWYVQPSPLSTGPSPLAGALAGVAWDSLPPATSLAELAPDSSTTVALVARLARRGPPRPMVTLSQRAGARRAVIAAGGLYRWAFRGGASGDAYRALVAGLVDWLLAEGAGSGERFHPVAYETPNGTAVLWRWTGAGDPRSAVLSLNAERRQRVDTLRFDAGGRAELRLAPGVYRYAASDAGGVERGVVAVDTYSDEWRPAAPVLAPQPGSPSGRLTGVGLRDRWWLFVVAIAAFAAEWAWRRREGLP
jgi:hypothetical protein